jgi:hypothetical protein
VKEKERQKQQRFISQRKRLEKTFYIKGSGRGTHRMKHKPEGTSEKSFEFVSKQKMWQRNF